MAKKYKRVSRTKRLRLLRDQFHRCAYCGEVIVMPVVGKPSHDPNTATVDHVTPRSKVSKADGELLTMACGRCNGLKADKPLLTFLAELRATQEANGHAAY